MSYFVEKTLASIPNIIANNFTSEYDFRKSGSFQSFIRNVSSINSKHEEETLIKKELQIQKEKLSKAKLTESERRESLCRLVYCQMLGYDVSFACIHAIQLAQSNNLLAKTTGYLICSLFLHEKHELVVLLVNTLQKDLKSSHRSVICLALTAVTQLVSTEMVPSLLPLVEEKLTRNPDPLVEMRAIACLHHMMCRVPSMHSHLEHHFRAGLSSSHVPVINVAVSAYFDLTQYNCAHYRQLVPLLTDILSAVISRKLPTDYDYHSVPAPWLTIQILKLLANLTACDKESSELVYAVLRDVLQKTEPSHKIGLAVIYECLQTCAVIYPHPSLVQHAARCVGRFLSSSNINLKYLGLKVLVSLTSVSPQYATEHQTLLMDCLQHRDASIRRQTLELLYRIASHTNVTVICDCFLQHLDQPSTDHNLKVNIVHKVADLAHRFAPDGPWYLETITKLMLLDDATLLPENIQQNLINFLQHGNRHFEQSLNNAQIYAMSLYWKLLQRDRPLGILVQTAVWVLVKYIHLVDEPSPADVATVLCHVFALSDDPTQIWIVAALRKLLPRLSASGRRLVGELCTKTHRPSALLQQSLVELQQLAGCSQTLLDEVCPLQDVDVDKLDFSLSFLDDFVSDALENGARPYVPRSMRSSLSQFTTASQPSRLTNSLCVPDGSSSGSVDMVHVTSGWSLVSGSSNNDVSSLNMTAVKKVWGPDGLIKEPELHTSNDKLHQDIMDTADHTDAGCLDNSAVIRDEVEERRHLASVLFGGCEPHNAS